MNLNPTRAIGWIWRKAKALARRRVLGTRVLYWAAVTATCVLLLVLFLVLPSVLVGREALNTKPAERAALLNGARAIVVQMEMALLTLLLGVLAIWRERIQALFFHPEFSVDPEPVHHEVNIGGVLPALYLACRIRNVGDESAIAVEALVTAVTLEGKPYELIAPFSMAWTHRDDPILAQIPPGSARLLTIGNVMKRDANVATAGLPEEARTCFRLSLVPEPDDRKREHYLPCGTYQIQLRIECRNGKPLDFVCDLVWTGEWRSRPGGVAYEDLAASFRRLPESTLRGDHAEARSQLAGRRKTLTST